MIQIQLLVKHNNTVSKHKLTEYCMSYLFFISFDLKVILCHGYFFFFKPALTLFLFVLQYSLAYACLKLVNYSFFFWLPFYLSNNYGWKEAEADRLSVWYDVGGIIGEWQAYITLYGWYWGKQDRI